MFLLMKRPQGVEQQAGKANSAVKESGEQCIYSGLLPGLKRVWQGHLGGVHLRSPVSRGTRPVVYTCLHILRLEEAIGSVRDEEEWGEQIPQDPHEAELPLSKRYHLCLPLRSSK